MRELDEGKTFTVTRNGVPVGELTPLRRHRFVGAEAARAYGRIYAAVISSGRKARRPPAVDRLIAATASAARLPLYTRNPEDFRGIEDLTEVIAV